MRVVCDRCMKVLPDGKNDSPCACGGTFLAWRAAYIPGLSSEPGKYDQQCEQVFISLKAPELVLLFVLGGPKGDGLSVSGQAQSVAVMPSVLRRIADKIELTLAARAVQS